MQKDTRFSINTKFELIPGALGVRQSNPSILDVVALKSSLTLFQEYRGITYPRDRSLKLTNHLTDLLIQSKYYQMNETTFKNSSILIGFEIITPFKKNKEHGSQISILIISKPEVTKNNSPMKRINCYLHDCGVITNERDSNVIRIVPALLYNTFEDIYCAVTSLNEALNYSNDYFKQ